MKNLEILIQELCPDGVEFRTMEEIFEIRNGYTPSKNNPDFWEGGTIPWFRMEDIRQNGRILSDAIQHITPAAIKGKGLFPANSIIIATTATIGEHALVIADSLANQQFTNLTVRKSLSACLLPKFVFYYMFVIDEWCKKNVNAGNFASVDMKRFKKLEFPLPPIEVQTEIVRILDKFTSLEAELEAELDCRKRQYEYYRDKLLSFDNVGEQEVEWKKIGEICDTLSGFPFDSSKFQTSGIKLMRGKNVKRGYFDFNEDDDRYWESPDGLEKYLLQDKDIIISMDGSLVGKSFAMLSKKHLPLLLVQRVARVRAKSVNQNYLFHNIAHRFSGYVDKKKTGGAIPHVSMKDIQNFSIPVPSLQEQERIATILDRFESLTTSLQSGLPAEISARRQQYEYYRDKLLTFKRKGAA